MPPIGWYLAQGLIPLGEDSSDDDDSPTTLPNGQVVCGPHGRIICDKCYLAFPEVEVEEDSDDEDIRGEYDDDDDDDQVLDWGAQGVPPNMDGPVLKRGSGLVFADKFVPPSATVTPEQLFSGRKTHIGIQRVVHRSDPGKVLIRTDGACLNNGQSNPKAGWGLFQGYIARTGEASITNGRLENKGPFGDDVPQTSNRAELRAVIAALRFRNWPGEGFHTLVIATDSEYVVVGSTVWTKTWVRNGWKTSAGADAKNKDLWEVLLGEFERWAEKRFKIELWRIPRELNGVADAAAREGAAQDAEDEWSDVMGMAF